MIRLATLLRPLLLTPLAACLLGLFLAPSVRAADYPNTSNFGVRFDVNSAWHRQCMETRDAQPPASDAVKNTDKDCDARDLYYDALNSAKAGDSEWRTVRACAQAARDDAVLMMLYANGLGVRRDLRLATRYACSLGGAYAEMEGRVGHLARLAQSAAEGKTAESFDLCDDITSGYMQGECAAIASHRAEAGREARLAAIAARLAPAQRKAWERLTDAADDFSEARGEHETDMSGTARAAMAIAAKDAEDELFLADLERFEKGDLPKGTAEHLAAADRRLNEIYRAIQHAKTDEPDNRLGPSTVTKADVQAAQKLWLRFRDAWTAFGRSRYPAAPAQAWPLLLTERRIEQLQDLLDLAEEAD
jgi:uncharacterized protein YecT (DUF1311 family)